MTRASGNNVSDYELIWHGETDKAIRVSQEETSEPFWLPKSQVEYELKRPPSKVVMVVIPDWLAKQHDLV